MKKIISTGTALAIVATQLMSGVPNDAAKKNSTQTTAYAYNESILGEWIQTEDTATRLNSYLENSYIRSILRTINEIIRRLKNKEPQEAFTNGEDNWSFSNSKSNFGSTYYMNDEYWDKLMDGLKNTEKQRIIDGVKNSEWGGSCYGMAVTSVLASQGIIDPSYWQDDAVTLHDITAPPTKDVKSLINYYFALQFTDQAYQRTSIAINTIEPLKLLKLINCLEDGSPALLTYFGLFNRMYPAGHAVVAYDMEYGTYDVDNKRYNGKILIYDNNSIDYDEEFCMYFSTTDGSWAIPAYELSSDYGDYLGLISDDMDVINYHGYVDGSNETLNYKYIAMLQSAPLKGKYKITKESDQDLYYENSTSSDDEIKMFSTLTDYVFRPSSIMFALKDTAATYLLSLEKPEELDLSMSYENSLLKANASLGAEARFSPKDYVSVSGKKTDYDLSIVLNDDYKVTDWYSFSVKGSGVTDATLQKEENGYILEASNLDNVTVNAHNDDVSVDVTFSTEYPKVFLFEKDENTIGIAVDTDNNGSFETELE